MKLEKVAKIAVGVTLSLAIFVSIAYVLDRDRPLGEEYKLAADYGGEFTLQTDAGEKSLSDYEGKVMVLYFGYMSCQDACPLSLAKLRTAIRRLSPEEKQLVQGGLITIDPERDNATDLGAFIRNYDDSFVGFTGSRAEIDKVMKQYGVFSELEDYENEATTYTVDHSSRFYMIGRDGKLLTTMSHSTTPAELVAKIRTML